MEYGLLTIIVKVVGKYDYAEKRIWSQLPTSRGVPTQILTLLVALDVWLERNHHEDGKVVDYARGHGMSTPYIVLRICSR